MRKMRTMLLAILLLASLAGGCGSGPASSSGSSSGTLTLATTTSTYDSGFLDAFIPVFEKTYNYQVKVVSLGTGQALELGKNGDADVLLVHAKTTELEMVEQGHFVDRYDVMYNDFIVVGPESDPAGIKSITEIKTAFAALAEKQSLFISRGDDSGTHKKELSLWEAAGLSPAGGWYVSAGSGMGDTLFMADEKEGYTLTDRATYLSLKDKLDLAVVFEGDKDLFNQYGVMAVNPANYPEINYEGAKLFIDFMISPEGQKVISNFKPYEETLFFPNTN